MNTQRTLVLAASPHATGSTALVADSITQGLCESGNYPALIGTWQYHFLGCDHCATCSHPPYACRLATEDDCELLFSAILSARLIFWISPVYFYGLPSQSKAFIDRGQRLWEATKAKKKSSTPSSATKQGHQVQTPKDTPRVVSVFISGQTAGTQLFTGSRLALRYFFELFGFQIETGLELRGINSCRDISPELTRQLADWSSAILHDKKKR